MEYEKTDLACLLNTVRTFLERAPTMSPTELAQEAEFHAINLRFFWEILDYEIQLENEANARRAATFPLSKRSFKPWDEARLTRVIQDLVRDVPISHIVEKERCAAWM